jgi:hypothetical protein
MLLALQVVSACQHFMTQISPVPTHVKDVTADEWAFQERKAEGEVPLLSHVDTASRTRYNLQ